jgi:hypothetical protein
VCESLASYTTQKSQLALMTHINTIIIFRQFQVHRLPKLIQRSHEEGSTTSTKHKCQSVVVPILGLVLVATLGQQRIGSAVVFFPRPYGPLDADVQGRRLAATESPRSVHRLPSASIAIAIDHQKKRKG